MNSISVISGWLLINDSMRFEIAIPTTLCAAGVRCSGKLKTDCVKK